MFDVHKPEGMAGLSVCPHLVGMIPIVIPIVVPFKGSFWPMVLISFVLHQMGPIRHLEVWSCLTGWWFGCHLLFSHILGMSSSQLTHIFQRGGPTTNQLIIWSFPKSERVTLIASKVAWNVRWLRVFRETHGDGWGSPKLWLRNPISPLHEIHNAPLREPYGFLVVPKKRKTFIVIPE